MASISGGEYKRMIARGGGGILLILVVDLLLAEALLRSVHAVFPLERPASLQDSYAHQMLEGGSWLDGRTRLYIYKPNTTGVTHGHPFKVNRWGFRGADFLERSQPEARDRFRIMVLGDSITSGIGIAEDDRYTNLLERKLRERYPSLQIEVINVAIQGFETVQEDKIMHRMWDVVGPDLIVVGFYVNDPNVTYDQYLPYKVPLPESVRHQAERLVTFRLLEPFYDPLYRTITGIPSFSAEMWHAYDRSTEDWKLFVQSVTDIGRWAGKYTRNPPIVIFLSDAREMRKMGAYDQVRDMFVSNGFYLV